MDPEASDGVGLLPTSPKMLDNQAKMRNKIAVNSSSEENSGSRKPAVGKLRKARSLYGDMQVSKFGPKAQLALGPTLTIQDPSGQMLEWLKAPTFVLVVKKLDDEDVIPPFLELLELLHQNDMVVFVEENVIDEDLLASNVRFREMKHKLKTFCAGVEDLSGKIDFIVSLGGDGTLIYASSLFKTSVPPVLAFNMGSLGFLTPFDADTMVKSVMKTIEGGVGLTLRSRLKCGVYQHSGLDPCLKETSDDSSSTLSESSSGLLTAKPFIYALNEVVIDRGPSPFLTNIDLYVDQRLVTSVQGDGLIVATPTGSTAYAAAAGSSMVHPCVPSIIITPICPHSLSFRPIVLPAGVEITVMASPASRGSAWLAFDGRNRQELKKGERLKITTSRYPLPSICAEGQLTDWFSSLAECLHWNVRQQQKAFRDKGLSLREQSTASSNSSLTSSGGTGDGTSPSDVSDTCAGAAF